MGRRRNYPPLNVFLNARHVGQLLRKSSGAISFVYNQDWLAWEHRLPVSLSLPLREDRYIGAPVDEAQIEALLGELDVAPLGIRKEKDFQISVAGV